MFCSKCGTPLPENCNACMNCGSVVGNETAEINPEPHNNSKRKTVIIVSVCLVAVLGLYLIINQIGKINLKDELMRDWSRTESNDGTYYTLELDFSDDEIEYNFDSFYVDSNIATYEYTVISGN